jgi:hypothetical protein
MKTLQNAAKLTLGLLRHSQYGFALVIKIDRRFADLTFAGDQYLNSGIAFS